jgi:hypothetical protein
MMKVAFVLCEETHDHDKAFDLDHRFLRVQDLDQSVYEHIRVLSRHSRQRRERHRGMVRDLRLVARKQVLLVTVRPFALNEVEMVLNNAKELRGRPFEGPNSGHSAGIWKRPKQRTTCSPCSFVVHFQRKLRESVAEERLEVGEDRPQGDAGGGDHTGEENSTDDEIALPAVRELLEILHKSCSLSC